MTTATQPRPQTQRPRLVLPSAHPVDAHPAPDRLRDAGDLGTAGDQYRRELARERLLSRDDEMALGYRAQAGDAAAIDELVRRNLRLVLPLARRAVGMTARGGGGGGAMDLDDLIQEGNIGLMRAATKFDPARGFKFSTMATWWIRQAIDRAVMEHGGTIRVPVHAETKARQVTRARQTIYATLGHDATEDELRAALPDWAEKDWKTVEQARAAAVVSLDKPMTTHSARAFAHNGGASDEVLRLGDLLADPATVDTAEDVAAQVDRDNEAAALHARMREVLTVREARTLALRYGFDPHEPGPHTLDAAGKVMGGISRERVRQLETSALAKLRKAARGKSKKGAR